MTIGHAISSSPVSTGVYPRLCCRMNGSDTIASICAVNEHIDVSIDSEKIGMRSRSNGNSGDSLPSCRLTYTKPTTAVATRVALTTGMATSCEKASIENISRPNVSAFNTQSRQSRRRPTTLTGFFGRNR